jgi:hypothetical protein
MATNGTLIHDALMMKMLELHIVDASLTQLQQNRVYGKSAVSPREKGSILTRTEIVLICRCKIDTNILSILHPSLSRLLSSLELLVIYFKAAVASDIRNGSASKYHIMIDRVIE